MAIRPISVISSIPTVTSFPTDPTDTPEVDLVVDDAGTYGGPYLWRCKYRSATAGSYKWHVISGAPLFIQNAIAQNIATTTPTVVPPAITMPFIGDWRFGWGGRLYQSNAAGHNANMALYLNNTTGGLTIDHYQGSVATSITISATNPMQRNRLTVTTVGHVADLRMWASSGTASSDNRWLEAMPLRLG